MASSILAGVSIRLIVRPSSRVSPRVKKGQPSRPDKQAQLYPVLHYSISIHATQRRVVLVGEQALQQVQHAGMRYRFGLFLRIRR